jgi:anaerobic magnesium-protoporphyrin IX monomethyl ester cyclase
MYIAAYLERAGVNVDILDANLSNMNDEEVALEVKRRRPEIVGLSAVTPTVKAAVKIMKSIRMTSPNVIGVIGGAHPTFLLAETLADCPELDIAVRGEGEETMLELVGALDGFSWENEEERREGSSRMHQFAERVSNVQGIAFRDPENVTFTRETPPHPLIKDLDSLPFPARHLLPFEQYGVRARKTPICAIITSRGCPYACDYCSSSRIGGVGLRCRSPGNVVDEIALLHEKYKVGQMEFLDDIFTLNKGRAVQKASQIKTRGLDINWIASSRVDTIDKDLILKLRNGGLNGVYYGVEAGSQRVLDLMNKRIRIEQVKDAFRATRECSVGTLGSFMFGYPGETLDEMRRTIDLSIKLDPDFAQFSILTPFPGTPLYERLKASGLLVTEDWDRYTVLEPVIRCEAFGYGAKKLKSILAEAYRRFYLRPYYFAKHIGQLSLVLGALFREIYSRIHEQLSISITPAK